jgi:polyisoprenoid-binding protein YceI
VKTPALLFLLALVAVPVRAADFTLELNPAGTKISWTLGDPLHTVHGTFSLKEGRISFDPETGKASGLVVVNVASGNSGSEARDHRMHANVLESQAWPEAKFVPERIEGNVAIAGASHVKLIGSFTIHGSAHEVPMDVQTTISGDQVHAAIGFDVPYVAWGMKDPSNFLLKVDKTVHVSIETTAPLQKK